MQGQTGLCGIRLPQVHTPQSVLSIDALGREGKMRQKTQELKVTLSYITSLRSARVREALDQRHETRLMK